MKTNELPPGTMVQHPDGESVVLAWGSMNIQGFNRINPDGTLQNMETCEVWEIEEESSNE